MRKVYGFMLVAFAASAWAQLNDKRGNAPGNVPQTTFFVHRLGTITPKA